jgi:hypothetical protein
LKAPETEKNKESLSQALENPSHSKYHEAIRYVQNTPFSQMFPKKHEATLIDIAIKKTITLHEENPSTPLKKVVNTIFESLTDDIPAPLILKITKKIIEKWTILSKESQKENIGLIAA